MKIICILGTVLLLGVVAVFSQDKPTSLSDARDAVEANMRTSAGKAFDEQFGKELMQKYLDNMRQCRKTEGADAENFWILLKLDKDGFVKEVLLSPTTKVGSCDRDVLLKAKFAAPPRDAYWLSIFLKVAK